ncbi:MAG: hypothetical protein ACFFAU_17245 [Candidatus Hodarchaeota archaeon]
MSFSNIKPQSEKNKAHFDSLMTQLNKIKTQLTNFFPTEITDFYHKNSIGIDILYSAIVNKIIKGHNSKITQFVKMIPNSGLDRYTGARTTYGIRKHPFSPRRSGAIYCIYNEVENIYFKDKKSFFNLKTQLEEIIPRENVDRIRNSIETRSKFPLKMEIEKADSDNVNIDKFMETTALFFLSPDFKMTTSNYSGDWEEFLQGIEDKSYLENLKQLNDVQRYRLKSSIYLDTISLQQFPNWPYGINSPLQLSKRDFHRLEGYILPIGILIKEKGRFAITALFTSRKENADRFLFPYGTGCSFLDYTQSTIKKFNSLPKGIRRSFVLIVFEFNHKDTHNYERIFFDFVSMLKGNESYLIVEKSKRKRIFSKNVIETYKDLGNIETVGIVKFGIRKLFNNSEICTFDLNERANKIFNYSHQSKDSRWQLMGEKARTAYKSMWDEISSCETVEEKIQLFKGYLTDGQTINKELKRYLHFEKIETDELKPINQIFSNIDKGYPPKYDCKHGVMLLMHFLKDDPEIQDFTLKFFNLSKKTHAADHVGLIIKTKDGQIFNFDINDENNWEGYITRDDWIYSYN